MNTLVGSMILAASLPLIKAPEAPFVEKPAELETPKLVLKADRIEAGTKALAWQSRDHNLEIHANGRNLVYFETRVAPSPGWQPFRRFDVTPGADAVTRTYAFSATETAKGLFTQRFSIENGKAAVLSTWTAAKGVPLENQVLTFAIPRDFAKGRTVRFTDAKGRVQTAKLPGDDAWDDRKDRTKALWTMQTHVNDPVEIVFDAEHPEYSFTLRFPAGTFDCINLFRAAEEASFYTCFDRKNLGKSVRIEVDFGRVAKAVAGDCVIDGVNFTRNNDFEVLRWGRRNHFANPSFEADARYWHDASTSALLDRHVVTGEAHSGRRSLRLKQAAHAFCFATKPNRKYTFSCWAKAPDGKGGDIALRTMNAAHENEFQNKYVTLKKGTTAWQRLSYTFDWTQRGMMFMISSYTGKDREPLLVDDLQLEEGDKPTDFEMPPYSMVLATDSPNGYMADADRPFNAYLVIRGAAGAKGKANISVKDFFGRETWNGQAAFLIGPGEETRIRACPECAVAAKGVFTVRVELDDGTGRPVVDHLRLARYRYAKGDEPSREVNQVRIPCWETHNITSVDDEIWRRLDTLGLRVFGTNLGDWWGPYDEATRKKIAAWYAAHGGTIKQELFPQRVIREKRKSGSPMYSYLHEEGLPWDRMPDKAMDYSEEEFAMIDRAVYRIVKENPWCKAWIGTSELGVMWEMSKRHNYKLYAKMMMVAHRALKRANPDATFFVHGTCNAGQQGRAEIHEVLEAAKAVDPNFVWDGVQVHPYRAHPEFPSLENDLKLLYEDLARHKMPKGLVAADEGSYYFPMMCKEWGDITPWKGTWETDQYCHMHMPSYDLGWGERVAAAMLLRANLQYYQFMPRLQYVNCWVSPMLDPYHVFAMYVGTAAQTEILGHAKFLKSVRFGDGARAYFYDDGKGNAVAAVWKFNVALDKGLEKASEMYVDAKFLADCEILDMMANRCGAEKVGGGGEKKVEKVGGGGEKATLPLSNFPFYLRVPKARQAALMKAIETCTTSDDGKKKKIYDPPAREIPYSAAKPDWTKVPEITLPYVELERDAKRRGEKWNGPDDLSVSCRLAWNEKGLWLRAVVKDDVFLLDRSQYKFGETQWYQCEGLQIFFDTLGDGRENFKMEMIGFSQDDSMYELLPTSEKTAVVFRRVAPDIQQTGGVADPLRAEVLVPEIACDFKWDPVAKTRTYEVFFPERHLMPMPLKPGAKIGCSFDVYDRDAPGKNAKQECTDIPLSEGSAYGNPHLYGNYILGPAK